MKSRTAALVSYTHFVLCENIHLRNAVYEDKHVWLSIPENHVAPPKPVDL